MTRSIVLSCMLTVFGVAPGGADILEITPAGFLDEVRELAIAPDQNHVAFLTSGNAGEALWWAPVDGSSDPVLLSGASTNLSQFVIAPGSDQVAFTAFSSGILELWATPVSSPAPVKLSTPSVNGRVSDPRFTDDGVLVLYREGPNGGDRRLWSAPADGSSAALPISDAGDNCSRFELPTGGLTVVFHADQPDVSRSELFVASVDGGSPPVTLSLDPGDPNDPSDEELLDIGDWQLTPDGTHVVYIAQRHWPDDPGNSAVDLELYAVSAAGPSGSEVRLDLDEPPTQKTYNDRTDAFTLSTDGETVVFRFSRSAANPAEAIDDHLFAAPLSGSAPPQELTTDADHLFTFNAAGTRAIYMGGDTTLADSLRSVPFTGGAFVTLDGDPLSSRVVGDGYLATPDGTAVVYPVGSERALWSSAVDGTGGPVEVTPWLGFDGDVLADFQITAESTTVVYRSDLELSGIYELYASPVAGGTTAKINEPALTGRHVFAVATTADERCVVFAAESSSTAPRRLFAADLHGTCALSPLIFADDFESGNLSAWTENAP